MFKFRFGGQGGNSPTQPPSIETVRRRARHRLLGASLLVLAGVIGFPLLFESQPRPVQSNFEIEIPSRKTAAALPAASPPAPAAGVRIEGLDDKEELVAAAPAASAPVPATNAPTHVQAQVPPTAPAAVPAPAAAVAPAPAAQPATPAVSAPSQPIHKPWEKSPGLVDKPAEPKVVETRPAEARKVDKPAERKPVEPKAAAKAPDDAARALALLEGRPQQDRPASEERSAAKGRHVVQVGAFVDPALAQETRLKLERAGLSTYTHVADTPDGKRTRVRLGPFSNRAEADKAAEKARALGLSAAILTL